jgi:hypothetical protein
MMKTFHSWKERVVAALGAETKDVPSRIRYVRKSTESDERQVASLEQQLEELDREFGPLEPAWIWSDKYTGTTFDRPDFQDMLAFCEANPKPKGVGRIEIFDPSRFGRSLNAEGQPDISKFISVASRFEEAGWQIEFKTMKRTGQQLVDLIMMALFAYAAAIYSVNLSTNVKRGRLSYAREGWWVFGSAPWGTKRKDTKSGRVLKDKEPSTPGGGGTILVPDRPVLKHWKSAAKMIQGGSSLNDVGEFLYTKGVQGPRGGKLSHSSVKNFLTNVALIGVVEYSGQEVKGKRERCRTQAKWPPMVDVDLFQEITKRLGGHSRAATGRRRRERALFPLEAACAHCGGEYVGGRLKAAQGSKRQYAHAKPTARADQEGRARFDREGCKVWYVDAEELETKIKDLIVQQRSSKEFENEVKELILQRDQHREAADNAVAHAKASVAQCEREYKRAVKISVAITGAEDGDEVLVEAAKTARRALEEAKNQLAEAEKFSRSKEDAWERVSAIIHETRNLAAAWKKASPQQRKVLLDYWVLDVQIVVEPIPDMLRANRKTAVVTLRTAPGTPLFFALDGGQPPTDDNAPSRAPATDPSPSTSKRRRKAPAAREEPNRPSAQAACDRTTGSGSSSAMTKAGMSASVPTLPSTTDASRLSPRSLARFMGDPLNAAENSSGDMASNSTASERASCPDIAARGAKGEPSGSSRENLRLYGHTS